MNIENLPKNYSKNSTKLFSSIDQLSSSRFEAGALLWFIFMCYHIYNVCLLHDFVATLRLSALPLCIVICFVQTSTVTTSLQ